MSDELPDQTPTEDEVAKATRDAARRLSRTGQPRPTKSRRLRSSATYSDSRDPMAVGRLMDQFMRDQGWQEQSAAARLMDQWAEVVGSDLASHVEPTSFTDGALHLTAESTAWATQVRLLLPELRKAIDAALGPGVVTSIEVKGPQAPSWVAGPRRVKGRGPRDTYG